MVSSSTILDALLAESIDASNSDALPEVQLPGALAQAPKRLATLAALTTLAMLVVLSFPATERVE